MNDETPRQWTPQQRKLIEWLATPKTEREPATEEELANLIGVISRTLRNWKRRPDFWKEVWTLAEMQLDERMAGIYRALADKAEAGNVSAMRLTFEVVGKIGQQGQAQQTVSVTPFTIEELAAAQAASDAWNSQFPANSVNPESE